MWKSRHRRDVHWLISAQANCARGLGAWGPTLRRSAEDAGYSKPQAAMAGAFGGGVIVASLSHPMDTIKTCQQGDVTQKTYRGVVHAGVEITRDDVGRRWRPGPPEISSATALHAADGPRMVRVQAVFFDACGWPIWTLPRSRLARVTPPSTALVRSFLPRTLPRPERHPEFPVVARTLALRGDGVCTSSAPRGSSRASRRVPATTTAFRASGSSRPSLHVREVVSTTQLGPSVHECRPRRPTTPARDPSM